MTAVKRATLVMFLAVVFATLGCKHSTLLEDHWGDAARANAAQMAMNPDASRVAGENPDLDPLSAEMAVEDYRENQKPVPNTGDVPSIIQIDAN